MADSIVSIDAQYVPFEAFRAWRVASPPLEVWNAYLTRLRQVRTEHPAAVAEIDEKSLRKAAYHTGALEGLHAADRGVTLTIVTAVAWREALSIEAGDETVEHVDAAISAFDLVLDVATALQPLSEALIRRLHELATAAQTTYDVVVEIDGARVRQAHPLPKGELKHAPNHVLQADGTMHADVPVAEAAHELRRLVDETRTDEFVLAHPVLQAAYVHHAFAVVHPFADGNGRVARLLASIYLLRVASIPLVIYEDEKAAYLTALRAADRGDHASFVEFVMERALDSMGWATDELLAAGPLSPSGDRIPPSDQLAARHAAATRLATACEVAFRALTSTEPRWHDQIWGISSSSPPPPIVLDDGREAVGDVGARHISLTSASMKFSEVRSIVVAMSVRPAPFALALAVVPLGVATPLAVLDVRDTDVVPELSMGFTSRLEAFVRRVLREMVVELERTIADGPR